MCNGVTIATGHFWRGRDVFFLFLEGHAGRLGIDVIKGGTR